MSIAFPPDMFDFLAERAEKDGTPFSEQVRLYVEWGRESAEEAN